MLGRLLRARLNSAESALASGRLDEAFRLASASDLAGERRAQQVLHRCGELLFERASEHYQGGRCAEALLDLDKAERAGVKPERVADLRTIVQAALADDRLRKDRRQERLQEAQRFLAAGSLHAVEEALQQAGPEDVDAQRLRRQAADRQERARQLFQEVSAYLDDDHLGAAAERYRRAQQLFPKSPEAARWEQVLVDRICASVQQALLDGRLNRAIEEFDMLHGIGETRSVKREQRGIIETVQAAGSALRNGDYEQARRKVLGLQHLLSGARWVKNTADLLGRIDEHITRLHGGPLGLLNAGEPSRAEAGAPVRNETVIAPSQASGDSLMPERLLILIDGSGSYLLIRTPRASLGRAATDDPADIPIVSDLSERHADIARLEDDYFLMAKREVNIGGRNVQRKLLQNGDRIVFGRRAKLTFKLPSRKSTSAVLDLGASCRLPNDVKRIVLFDRFATIGRRANAHMVVPTAGEDLLLYERSGKLWVRHKAGGKGDEGQPIELGRPFECAGVSMVVEPWRIRV